MCSYLVAVVESVVSTEDLHVGTKEYRKLKSQFMVYNIYTAKMHHNKPSVVSLSSLKELFSFLAMCFIPTVGWIRALHTFFQLHSTHVSIFGLAHIQYVYSENAS